MIPDNQTANTEPAFEEAQKPPCPTPAENDAKANGFCGDSTGAPEEEGGAGRETVQLHAEQKEAHQEPAATDEDKGKTAQKKEAPSFTGKKHITAAPEESGTDPVPPGLVLPEPVISYYRQFGLSEQEIQLIFQAKPPEIPSRPETPAPTGSGRKPGG